MENDGYEFYWLGIESIKKEEWETAYDQLCKSLAIQPHFKTCERLAFVLEQLGQTQEANRMLEKAFELNLRNDLVAYRYAKMLFRLGQIEKTRAVLMGVLARNPTYGPAKRLMGELKE